jgi:nicotinamide-nucleotide amidase
VGLVYFAAARSGFELLAEHHVFPGDRDGIRRLATITALSLLAMLAKR